MTKVTEFLFLPLNNNYINSYACLRRALYKPKISLNDNLACKELLNLTIGIYSEYINI